MVPLAWGKRAALHKKSAGVALQYLHSAVSPAETLLLEINERIRHQPAAVAGGRIGRLETSLEDPQAELGVFGNAPLRPTRRLQLRTAHHSHRAMLDDGVTLVARDHADVEEPAILGIAHCLERTHVFVAVVLRCLDDGDTWILKARYEIAQPPGIHDVVAVDHGNNPRIGSGVPQSEIQSASLEAGKRRDMKEAEALAQAGTMGLHRAPDPLVRGVVIDH